MQQCLRALACPCRLVLLAEAPVDQLVDGGFDVCGRWGESRSRSRNPRPAHRCALRRAELVGLEVGKIQQRAGRWVIPDLKGKGNRLRTVPIPAWVKQLVDAWVSRSGIVEGALFRSINKGNKITGEPLTENAVWWIARAYGDLLGLGNLAPPDLRRTCAKLCRDSGGALEQIQLLLGHASIQTTMNYLGTRLNLSEAVNDRLGIAAAE